MRLPRSGLLVLLLMLLATMAPSLAAQPSATTAVYLPLVLAPGAAPGQPTTRAPRVNAPFFDVTDLGAKIGEMAVFWFGRVTPSENYADVRVGYSSTELFVHVAVFDRRLWYDETPQVADLAAWDALTLYLSTGAVSRRLVAQLSQDGSAAYQAAASLTNGAWVAQSTAFTTWPGWRGERLNDDGDDRGWAMTFRVPFTSMGLVGRPADGTAWRMALALHDRDALSGTPAPAKLWPPTADPAAPASWGTLAFGLPAGGRTPGSGASTVTIRQGLGGASVPDAGVGGGSICGDGLDFWSQWGDASRDAGKADFNVQNQADVADWPCFAKYYVTFPLESLPRGRTVVSATLVLHQFGNSEPSQARPSLIQALTVGTAWQEQTLTWNNAPLALENIGSGWVMPLASTADWPGVRRTIDVTYGVARAYATNSPLRLALYSADSDYHSGKYFVSSDTGDWNAVGRPTLVVTLGSP